MPGKKPEVQPEEVSHSCGAPGVVLLGYAVGLPDASADFTCATANAFQSPPGAAAGAAAEAVDKTRSDSAQRNIAAETAKTF